MKEKIIFFCLFVFFLSFLFYVSTLAPTILWGDSAKLALFVNSFIEKPYIPSFQKGGAHGLHTILGGLFVKLVPFGSLAYKLNLFSALTSAITVALFFLLIFKLTNSVVSAVFSSLFLSVSHMFWFSSVICESYSLLSLTFTSVIFATVSWYYNRTKPKVFIIAALFIIGIANHMLLFLSIPVVFAFIYLQASISLRRVKWHIISLFLAAVILVAVPFLRKIIYEFLQTVWIHLTVYSQYSKLFKELLLVPVYLFYQFPFTLPVSLIGLYSLFKKEKNLSCFFAILFLTDIVFASFFGKTRQLYQMIPSFIVFAAFIGLGIKKIEEKYDKTVLIPVFSLLLIVSPCIYYVVTRGANKLKVNLVSNSTFAYRNANIYYLWPSKRGDYDTYNFAKNALAEVNKGGTIVADFNIYRPLRYLKEVEKHRNDVELIEVNEFSYQKSDKIWNDLTSCIDNVIAKKGEIYLAAYESLQFVASDKSEYYIKEKLNEKYKVIPKGIIFRISNYGKKS